MRKSHMAEVEILLYAVIGVLIISHSAVALSARLKALGVESVMAERNPRSGDNWTLRYDCMRFHIPTSFCDLPYRCKTLLQLKTYFTSFDGLFYTRIIH